LPEAVRLRRDLGAQYARLLEELKLACPPSEPAWARSNWQSYCVRLPTALTSAA
jgi:dTDP-4-amino-4,6-dideoxygalactose transaminase